MKNKPNILSALLMFILAGMIVPFIMSCGKEAAASVSGLNTELNIINVSPDVFPVDFFINGRTQNSNKYYIYNVPSNYFFLASLDVPIQVRTLTNVTIFTKHDTALSVNTKYTLFITGLLSEKTLRTIFTVDSDAAPSRGTGKVRFVNASARPVNLDLYANGTMAFQNQGFAAVTKYVELSAGIYDFKLYNTGTTTIVNDLSNITIQDGRLYTFYCKGIVGRTDSAAFGSAVLTNK